MGMLDLFKGKPTKKVGRRSYYGANTGRLFADFISSSRSADSRSGHRSAFCATDAERSAGTIPMPSAICKSWRRTSWATLASRCKSASGTMTTASTL